MSVSASPGNTGKSWFRMLLPLVIIGGAAGVAALLIMTRPQPESDPVEERIVLVETRPLQAMDVTVKVRSQGTVQPRTSTTLVAEVSGVINEVSDQLVAGGFVRAGEMLAKIDDADYQVAVEQARAALLTAQAQLTLEQAQSEQAAREWDLSGRPREEAPVLALRTPYLREAEARVLSAEAELERAQRQLQRTRVAAPFDALVREKVADMGQFVSTGTQIAQVFATDYAEIRLPLSDRDLSWLDLPRPGDPSAAPVPVTLKGQVAGSTVQWQANIVRTEGVIDSSSRLHFAVARLDDPYALQSDHHPLMAGTFVTAEIEGHRLQNVFKVPQSALYRGSEVLTMDREQRLRRHAADILYSDGDFVYLEGLNPAEQLIVSPVQIPIDGMRVNPQLGKL